MSCPLRIQTHIELFLFGEDRTFEFLTYLILFTQQIKPTVLIGTSGQGKTFTQEVVEAMAEINEVLLLLLYSIDQSIDPSF